MSKPEFDKPVAEMTLFEIKEWCRQYRILNPEGFCEESGCDLYERGICSRGWVHDWDISEHSRFTAEEIRLMESILQFWGGAEFRRMENGHCLLGGIPVANEGIFPAVKPGETIQLADEVTRYYEATYQN